MGPYTNTTYTILSNYNRLYSSPTYYAIRYKLPTNNHL